jgi:pyridoxal 5'-phosphate synthase pdxS subunit
MRLGAEAVFVGSGIFLSESPAVRARAIVEAVTHWCDAARLAEISTGLGIAMRGTEAATLAVDERLAARGV